MYLRPRLQRLARNYGCSATDHNRATIEAPMMGLRGVASHNED
jgi:hypothetical protein